MDFHVMSYRKSNFCSFCGLILYCNAYKIEMVFNNYIYSTSKYHIAGNFEKV